MSALRVSPFLLMLCFSGVFGAAQKPGDMNLAASCFDSLPFGQARSCDLLLLSKNKYSPASL